MISCRNLSFYYGKRKIINNADIDLPKEGIYALVGENGVGKTTFLKIVLGLLHADGIKNYYSNASFSLEENALYENLTVFENLYYFALLKSVAIIKIDEVINKCNIKNYTKTKIKNLSKGTKQKVLLAKCLLNDSHLYVFDEPFNGLDPREVNNLKIILKSLKNEGKMIIVSSHILQGVEDICDYVIYMKDKKIHLFDKKNLTCINKLFEDNL